MRDFGMMLSEKPVLSVVPAPTPQSDDDWQIHYFDGHPIRCKLIEGEPWFIVGDACKAVGLDNVTMALTRVDGDDINETEVISPYGSNGATRRQTVKIVIEYGLYDLILGSDKPEAKRFKRWITHEVIPSIRKTGSYSVQPTIEEGSELDVIAQAGQNILKAVEIAKEERAQKEIAQRQVIALAGVVVEKDEKIKELTPLAEAWKTMADTKGLVDVADAAKFFSDDPAIQIGQNTLFKRMNAWGWVFKRSGYWRAKQKQVDNGRLKMKYGEWVDDEGREHESAKTQMTFKGLEDAYQILKAEVQQQD